jgi:hypothetical protein
MHDTPWLLQNSWFKRFRKNIEPSHVDIHNEVKASVVGLPDLFVSEFVLTSSCNIRNAVDLAKSFLSIFKE